VFHLRTPEASADADGRTTFDASYVLAEVGLAYSFKGHVTLTLGYRSQTVKTNGYALSAVPFNSSTSSTSSPPLPPYASAQLRDITQGPTLGLAASF
jgi:hypothetical protein